MTRLPFLNRFLIPVALLVLGFPAMTFAQAGVSSMSMGVGRAGVASNARAFGRRSPLPAPDLIRIEEFINYHRHDLPLPESSSVRLDVQSMETQDGKRIYQFGLTTPRAINPDDVPPLNLVLVIDRSGSMRGDRMAKVKEGLLKLVQKLRKRDRVTLVGFSNQAAVHLSACDKTKTRKISDAIERLTPGGSTNLHAGLMLGYRQAQENFDAERSNRVILLTDGLANAGVTDLNRIAHESKQFNQQGIDLSTIGLGHDLNHELLRELADAGRGMIHFVDGHADIKKTFVKEVDALLAPAAREVELTIDFGNSKVAQSAKVYGYQPKSNQRGTGFRIKLDNLNCGATQVVMVKVPSAFPTEVAAKKESSKRSKRVAKLSRRSETKSACVTATLKFVDAVTGEDKVLNGAVPKVVRSMQTHEDSLDRLSSVRRNYAIALLSQALAKACEASHQGDLKKAAKRLGKSLKASKKIASHNDKEVKRMVDIVSEYSKALETALSRQNRMESRDRDTDG